MRQFEGSPGRTGFRMPARADGCPPHGAQRTSFLLIDSIRPLKPGSL